jgi:hypothetical protein
MPKTQEQYTYRAGQKIRHEKSIVNLSWVS